MYIGVDVDNRDWNAIYTICKSKYLAKWVGGTYRITRTRKGFHVRLYLPFEITPESAIAIRQYLGDDPWRIDYDIARLKVARDLLDVLYEEKATGKYYEATGKAIIDTYYREVDVDIC